GPWRESLDAVVHLHWLHRMKPSWRKDHGADRFASSLRSAAPPDDAHLVRLPDGVAHAEQWSAVFADLHPDDFGCVPEAPRLHHLHGLTLVSVRAPEEQPGVVRNRRQREPHDVRRAEHVVVLRGSALATWQTIAKHPRWVGEDDAEGVRMHRSLRKATAGRASTRRETSGTPRP